MCTQKFIYSSKDGAVSVLLNFETESKNRIKFDLYDQNISFKMTIKIKEKIKRISPIKLGF